MQSWKILKMCSRRYPGLPPRRDIDFSINLMPGASPVSNSLQNEYTRIEGVGNVA
jgi:hypothetical protein